VKTPEKIRKRESARKARKRKENRERLRLMKQWRYFRRTGRWEWDPTHLHWHHRDPGMKTRKVCHLVTRSWKRIMQEIEHCVVLDREEHLDLHGLSMLRTK
jgi:hypothetical protein